MPSLDPNRHLPLLRVDTGPDLPSGVLTSSGVLPSATLVCSAAERAGSLSAVASKGHPNTAAGEDVDGESLFQVGELARATGKTVRAIHLYEDMGLLRPQDRSKGRYRLFSLDSVVRVRWISKLQSLGLSLSDIQELVKEHQDSGSAMFAAAKLRDVYAQKLEETRSKLRELALLEAELQASLQYLSGCDTSCMPELPTHSCCSCVRHSEHTEAPDLVAGARAQ